MSATSITGLKVHHRAFDLGLFAIEPKTLAVLEVTQCVRHTPEVPRPHANHGGDPFTRGDLRDPGLPGLADAGAADPSYGSRGRV